MKKHFKKTAAVAMACMIGCSLAACGPNVPEGFTPIDYICSGLTGQNMEIYKELVDTYNATQGQQDKVYVTGKYSTVEYAQYSSELNRGTSYSVATVSERQIRGLATATAKNGFTDLSPLLTDDVKSKMGFDTIPENMVNSFRVDSEITDGKYNVGEGARLLGVPVSANPHVLYYNPKILTEKGINIVHVGEAELDAYNSASGASLAPCGYAEYAQKPFEGATSTVNANNETVYRVFNDRIPMSWAEQRLIARTCQKEFGYQWGYMSEFWYNYGWTVGGDAIVWDETKGEYTLSLCDTYPNYLADAAVEINHNVYEQGDVVRGADALWLSQNAAQKAAVEDKLVELPSMYQAFLEFNRLGVPQSSQVDKGYYGYGVAPNTMVNRNAYFLTGNNCPFLVDDYSLGPTFSQSAIGKNWNIAPLAQYREYKDDETYYNGSSKFENEYLKVIGKSYGGKVYTGELKTTDNGTKIVGDSATASYYKALCIPEKAPEGTKDAAIKFITWVAGEEGQKIIGRTGTAISNHPQYNMSDEYTAQAYNNCNAYAAALMIEDSYVGDYSYFNSHSWIDNWSGLLNGEVREGKKTLQYFLENKLEQANSDLSNMNIRIIGR